ncbi:DNA alkylation repair protein [Undibacterium flavidum]|uniref:DNA alkylation repair protein n=1 Tax=Undibacterium flavidum TaxID=2762297 RepID=A0ABR6YA53_9BURK|nr:DNA alkylation repair protein [Undibacterium flavidum]MBC3873449.1 DNA alkylation repair protein [Undibacterium flavidum]
MHVSDFFQQIQIVLLAHANSENALPMRAYMRSHFDFLGIKTPLRRQLLKDVGKISASATELLQLAQALWQLPQREFQYVAIDVLAQHRKILTLEHIPELLALAQQQAWWDSVDGLASVIGDVIFAAHSNNSNAQVCMDHALQDSSMWIRRIAMIHQLGWRLQTDTQRLFFYAEQLAGEDEFFIRKAIGWALRDFAKWNPELVRSFVATNAEKLSALTVREAQKNL